MYVEGVRTERAVGPPVEEPGVGVGGQGGPGRAATVRRWRTDLRTAKAEMPGQRLRSFS